MPGRDTQYEALAREAAARIDQDRDLQEQLTFLDDDVGLEDDAGERPTRGRSKALSQFREWLASKGLRLPEEQIARIAGLADGDPDPIRRAMADAERILAWAEAGAVSIKGTPAVQSMTARLAVFERCYGAQLRAAEALLPYGLSKATPEPGDLPVIPLFAVPAAPAQVRQMRDVTPIAGRLMAPADVLHENERNQQVRRGEMARPTADPDEDSRTE